MSKSLDPRTEAAAKLLDQIIEDLRYRTDDFERRKHTLKSEGWAHFDVKLDGTYHDIRAWRKAMHGRFSRPDPCA
jgi:hypothetical protein